MIVIIPTINGEPVAAFEIGELPTRTYFIDTSKNSVNGFCDELAALKQAIYLILNTERYDYIIYSRNYGISLKDLFGAAIPDVYPLIQTRIADALTQDTRVTSVSGFEFSNNRNKVSVSFLVGSVYGEFSGSVDVNV